MFTRFAVPLLLIVGMAGFLLVFWYSSPPRWAIALAAFWGCSECYMERMRRRS